MNVGLLNQDAKVRLGVTKGIGNASQKIARLAAVIGTTNSLDINFFDQRLLENTESIPDDELVSGQHVFQFSDLTPGTTYYVRAGARTINTGSYYNYSPVIEINTSGN